MSSDSTAYFVPAVNDAERGPGILVLHSWWGLTARVKEFCEHLSDNGFCALAPDFFGSVADTLDNAHRLLNEADPNKMADLVLSSIHALRSYSDDPDAPVAIIGFAMGGSLALWASSRLPESVAAVVSVYGTQDIDFDKSHSDYLLVSAENDDVATPDEMSYTQALIGLADRPIEAITITGTEHGFAEEQDPAFNEESYLALTEHIDGFLAAHFRSV